MSLDLREIRTERFPEIGRLIERDAQWIVNDWLRQLETGDHGATPEALAEMRKHWPEFVQAVGKRLADPRAIESMSDFLMAIGRGEQSGPRARRLDEVIRDYQTLRLTILAHLDKSLPRPVELREVFAVGLLLDEAITAVAGAYVAKHECGVRQAQEQVDRLQQTHAQYLTKMSHDLRTPMTSILGMTELALTSELSREVRGYLKTSLESGKALLELLNELHAAARGKVPEPAAEVCRFDAPPRPDGARTLGSEGAIAAPQTVRVAPTSDRVWDLTGTMNRLAGSEELFQDIVEYYFEDSPELIERMRDGLRDQQHYTVERAAHSLRGLASSFGADRTVACAREIEQKARRGEMASLAESLAHLEQENERLLQALAPHLRATKASG